MNINLSRYIVDAAFVLTLAVMIDRAVYYLSEALWLTYEDVRMHSDLYMKHPQSIRFKLLRVPTRHHNTFNVNNLQPGIQIAA